MEKSNPTPFPNVNDAFNFVLDLSCSSSTGPCIGVEIRDTIPEYLQFLNFSNPLPAGVASATYEPVTREAVITFDANVSAGSSIQLNIQVLFPFGTLDGSVATNTAYASSTNAGTDVSSATATAQNGRTPGDFPDEKDGHSSLVAGGYQFWQIVIGNIGFTTIDDYSIIDTIPAGMILDQIRTPEFANVDHMGSLYYQRSGDPGVWYLWTGFNLNNRQTHNVAGLGLPVGEYVSIVRLDLNSVSGSGLYNPYIYRDRFRSTWTVYAFERGGRMMGDTFTNCANYSGTSGGFPISDVDCITTTVAEPVDIVGGNLDPIGEDGNSQELYSIEDTMNIALEFFSGPNMGFEIVGGVMAVVLPPNVSYIPGSWYFGFGEDNADNQTPIVETETLIDGRELVRFVFDSMHNNSFIIEPNTFWEGFRIVLRTVISPAAMQGSFDLEYYYYAAHSTHDNCNVNDVNGYLGGYSTYVCNENRNVDIVRPPGSAGLESTMEVIGTLDTDYSQYPERALTVPGGISNYRIIIKNPNVDEIDQLVFVTVFPHIGDHEVLDDSTPRFSEWQPTLAEAVSTGIAQLDVEYTTVSNPCRDDLSGSNPTPFPTGCNTASWSATPPADITDVTALRFDYGNTRLAQNDSLVVSFSMRSPVDGLPDTSIAWNSFAYAARNWEDFTDLLPAEPIKVGIELRPGNNPIVGDFVWEDTEPNGIQDVGEVGLDGIRVELYHDVDNDGVPEPSGPDTLELWTVTAAGGKYLFSDFDYGRYFIVFSDIPTGYVPTHQDIGSDDLDSDGLISSVMLFDNTVIDYSLDLGLYNGVIPQQVGLPDCFLAPDETSVLSAFDLVTASEILLGNHGLTGIEAIEYDPLNQRLYGANSAELYLLDALTAAPILVGPFSPLNDADGTLGVLGFTDVDGMARDPINDLWFAAARVDDPVQCGRPDVLFQFDPLTGAYIPGAFDDFNGDGDPDDYVEIEIPSMAPCLHLIDDMGFDPLTNTLYGIANGIETYFNQTLVVTIDPITGETSNSGNITYFDGTAFVNLVDVEGLSITLDNRVLVTTGKLGNPANSVFELNGVGSSSVTATLLKQLSYQDYEGITCLTLSDPAVIGEFVYEDLNNNGVFNSGEPGIDSVLLYLVNSLTGDTLSQTLTNGLGGYSFEGVYPGTYEVHIGLENYLADYSLFGHTLTEDPDNVLDGVGTTIPLLSGSEDLTMNFGFAPAPAYIISGTIYEDINYGGGAGVDYNGANASAQSSGWTNGDIGIDNARVELYDNTGAFVDFTLTDVDGLYTFTDVMPGTYAVRVVSGSLSSNRPSNSTGQTIIPVQTYRQDASSVFDNEIGGADPTKVDAAANNSSANLSSLNTTTTIGQSISSVTVSSADITDIDFGFNYDIIVNTNDTGQGSLRQFIRNSDELDNTNLDQVDNPTGGVSFPKDAGVETSIFMIDGGGVHTITPLSAYSLIRDEFTHITGYTQSGSAVGPIDSRTLTIELKGNTVLFDALNISASNTQISGLAVNTFRSGIRTSSSGQGLFVWGNYVGTDLTGLIGEGNIAMGISLQDYDASFIGTNGDGIGDANEGNLVSDNDFGIQIRSTTDVLIAGNIIGLNKDGNAPMGNNFHGIFIRDADGTNVVGFDDQSTSTVAAHFKNVSSANDNDGIRVLSSSDQMISGNYFGTDVTGTIAFGNTNYGIQIQGAASDNIIGTDSDGDDDASERNVISGNGSGLRFLVSGTGTNNRISGNYIGVSASGNTDLGNLTSGLDINGSYSQTIIGTNGDNINDLAERNVISGNGDDGMRFTNSSDNIIAGNFIGLGADGTTAIPNDKRGVFFTTTSANNTVGYDPSMANQDALIVGNRIENNGDTGIGHAGVGTQNRFSRNQIANNQSLGIDLDYDGVTPNDDGDGDTGANDLINFPVITSSLLLNDNLLIQGFAPAGSSIEFYVADTGPSPSPLPTLFTSSFGEGSRYLFTIEEGGPDDTQSTTGSYNNDGTGVIGSRTQAQFAFSIDVSSLSLAPGFRLSAIAIDANGNTSEFSGVFEIRENCGTATTNPHIMYYRSR